MWELVGAQLTFGCLDVAVISTRVNGVGMFLRRAEPASTLGAWAGLGSGCFFWVFFLCFPVASSFFLEGRGPPQAKAPHEVCWHLIIVGIIIHSIIPLLRCRITVRFLLCLSGIPGHVGFMIVIIIV